MPATLRKASAILRANPPEGLTQEQIDQKIDCLNAPYTERILRTFRVAMAATDNPCTQAEKILTVINDHGLEPYEPPKALAEITKDDIHLICWLALT